MLVQGEKAALQFSGGKDSLALLYLARPYLSQITVFFGDTGRVYPHVSRFVRDTCRDLGAELVTVAPPQDLFAYHESHGLPSDIVPVDASPEMARILPDKPRQLLQSPLTCCTAMLWRPMYDAIRARGFNIVLRGSKRCDPHVTAPHGFVDLDGIEYRSPLWDWSHARVLDYLDGRPMPDQYPAIMDSMDCWPCTAFMGGKYAAAKLAYAREHYPDLWPEIKRRVDTVRETVARETATINQAFAAV